MEKAKFKEIYLPPQSNIRKVILFQSLQGSKQIFSGLKIFDEKKKAILTAGRTADPCTISGELVLTEN